MRCSYSCLLLMLCLYSIIPDDLHAGYVYNNSPHNYLIARILSGKVTDETGKPMPGVVVTVRKTQKGAITEQDGIYRLEIENGTDSIEFSYVGYRTKVVTAENNTILNIQLQPDKEKSLQDVVVVGYGTQKKASTIGAQSTIKPEELKQPVANLSTLLAGRIAGFVAVQRSGEPGRDNADVWIRGISTFTNSSPLYLVDGVERDFRYINPEDIETFSVLKDASATAVYGVRGANGVVIITTKQGKAGKTHFGFEYNEAMTSFTNLPKLADGVTYMKLVNEALTTRDPNVSPRFTQERIDNTASKSDPYLYPDVDWFKEIFNKYGHNRRANLNVRGGNGNANFYVSAGYFEEKGFFKTDELAKYNAAIKFKKINLLSNLHVRATASTTLDVGVQGYITNGNYPGVSSDQIFADALALNPVAYPVKYPGNLIGGSEQNNGLPNPWADVTQSGYRSEFGNQLFTNIRARQDLGFVLHGLSFTAMGSFDASSQHNISRTKKLDTWFASGRDANGELILYRTFTGNSYLGYDRANGGTRRSYMEAAFNYDEHFGRHSLTGLLLYNMGEFVDAFANDFTGSIPFRTQGVAGRATYGYDDRYFAEVNFGYNGSENFVPSRRYGFFPSYGVGWMISKEKFFKPLTPYINLLKVRGSYGKAGNSNIGSRRFAYMDVINTNTGRYMFGESRNTVTALDITDYAVNVVWETSAKTNLGIEIGAFGGNTNLIVELFKERRSNIFLQRNSLPVISGVQNYPYGNLGIVENKGIDISLEQRFKTGEFNFSVRGNFNFNRNKVIENDAPAAKYPWLEQRGQRVGGQRMGYVALGLFKDEKDVRESSRQVGNVLPGDIKFADLNGDGQINADDMTYQGYGNVPEITYGFGLNAVYRNFALTGFFQGISHVDIMLAGNSITGFQNSDRSSVLSNIVDRWTPDNQNQHAFYPRLGFGNTNDNYQPSSWWLRDGSFLRLREVTLTYSLPARIYKRAGLQSARLYLQGTNLATFSKFKLWDVELGGTGNGDRYPLVKTVSLGLNIQF